MSRTRLGKSMEIKNEKLKKGFQPTSDLMKYVLPRNSFVWPWNIGWSVPGIIEGTRQFRSHAFPSDLLCSGKVYVKGSAWKRQDSEILQNSDQQEKLHINVMGV